MAKGSSKRKKEILEQPEGRKKIEKAEIWIYTIDNPFHLEFYEAYLIDTKIVTPDTQGNDI